MFASDPLSESDYLLLQAYLDNELPAAERLTFEARLAAEPALAAELTRWQQLTETLTLEQLPDLDPEVDFATGVMKTLAARQGTPDGRIGWVVWLQAALAVAVILFGRPLLSRLQPTGAANLTHWQSEILFWINRLGAWGIDQWILLQEGWQLVPLGDLLIISPEVMTILLVVGALAGLLWLGSVGYILRNQDWRPAD